MILTFQNHRTATLTDTHLIPAGDPLVDHLEPELFIEPTKYPGELESVKETRLWSEDKENTTKSSFMRRCAVCPVHS